VVVGLRSPASSWRRWSGRCAACLLRAPPRRAG
jgi:hypothetical protein